MIRATYTYTVPHTEENGFADGVGALAIAQDAEVRRGRVAADLGWAIDQVQLMKIEFVHEPNRAGIAPPEGAPSAEGAE